MNKLLTFAVKHLKKKKNFQNKEVVGMGDLQQENQYGTSQWNLSSYSRCNF